MTKCFYCKKSSNIYRGPKGRLLKYLKRRRPEVSEATLMCPTCYGKAKVLINERKTAQKQSQDPAVSSVGSIEHSLASSSDTFDRLVSQRSLRSIERAKKADGNRLRESTRQTRALQYDPVPSTSKYIVGSDTSSSSNSVDVTIIKSGQEMARANEMAKQVAAASETIQNALPEDQLALPSSASLSGEPLASDDVERFYEEDDDDDTPSILNPAHRLPGVQPFVKRRVTRVVFTDERLIPVYNNKSYGG